MNNTTITPTEIFESPEAWFAGFGITVREVSHPRACSICADDDLGFRIAA